MEDENIEKIDDDDDSYEWDQDDGPKILCPYCNAPYTSQMKTKYSETMGSMRTGAYNERCSVKIFCDNCKKLVYQKN